MTDPLYFDFNATTPLLPEVVDAMIPYLREHFGNPSSGHVYGQRAKQAVEHARAQVAALLHCDSKELLFTSGGTESNNLAILGLTRAHQGVDYAAPKGTPIKAAGNAKIAFRGWKSGYGNCIILQHSNQYTTLYGHMSRFADNLRVGSRVAQGQTIGFVGMTGLATAPHLHYEFRINGVHRDPLSIDLPKADPLTGAQLADFRQLLKPLLAQLDLLEQRQGALAAR